VNGKRFAMEAHFRSRQLRTGGSLWSGSVCRARPQECGLRRDMQGGRPPRNRGAGKTLAEPIDPADSPGPPAKALFR